MDSAFTKTSQKDGSADWQTQRYRKAMQRSREVKQQRKSVQPAALQSPVGQTSLNSGNHHHTQFQENIADKSFSQRAIIDTSIHMDLKHSEKTDRLELQAASHDDFKYGTDSSILHSKDNASLKGADNMRKVLSTISTNSPPRIKDGRTVDNNLRKSTLTSTDVSALQSINGSVKPLKKSPKTGSSIKQSSSSPQSSREDTISSQELKNDEMNRHYRSLAKSIQDKMKLKDTQIHFKEDYKNPNSRLDNAEKHMTSLEKLESITNGITQEDNSLTSSPNMNQTPSDEYSHFILELKQEVSQDHNELWKSFQTLFGRLDETKQTLLNPFSQSSSQGKIRLSASSQKKLRDIHDFLNTHCSKGFCVSDTQLVNDKRWRKEKEMRIGVSTSSVSHSIGIPESPMATSIRIQPSPSHSLISIKDKSSNKDGIIIRPDHRSQRELESLPTLLQIESGCELSVPSEIHMFETASSVKRSNKSPSSVDTNSNHLVKAIISSTTDNYSVASDKSTSLNTFHDKRDSNPDLNRNEHSTTNNDKNKTIDHTGKKSSSLNVRPPLPPSGASVKLDRVIKEGGKRLSWLSSLREKQKKHGKRLHLSDDESVKDDETASVTTNDLEQYSIQKVGIDNVIAIFGTKASPSRRPSMDETFLRKGSPSSHTPPLGLFSNRPNSNSNSSFLSTPKSWSIRETMFSTPPGVESPLDQAKSELKSSNKQSIVPHPLSVGDVIDLLNLPKRIFKPDELVVRLPLSMKDDRRQFVVLGKDTILTACSFASHGSASKPLIKDSANILWCSYRSQVKSITLSNDATVALISLLDETSCQLSFNNTLDCMLFMKGYYSVSEVESQNESFRTVDESYEDEDDDGVVRGSPKAKRDEESDVTSSTIVPLQPSKDEAFVASSSEMMPCKVTVDGIPLSEDEINVLVNYRKSQRDRVLVPDTVNSREDTQENITLVESKCHDNMADHDKSSTPQPCTESNPSQISNVSSANGQLILTLSEQDKMIAEKYLKMLKFSIPMDAVAHKMKMDQVSDHIVAVVRDSCSSCDVVQNAPSSSDSSLPSGNVTNPSSAPQLSEEESICVETYRKMLKVGLERDVVRHRMMKDKVSALVIEIVLGRDGNTSTAVDGNNLSPEQNKIVLFYQNMLKMGIPKDAVRHKMKMDQVDEFIVSIVLNEKKQSKCDHDIPSTKKSNLKSLNWTPITEDELSNNSVWKVSTKKRKRSTMSILSESQDMSRLEELFQKKNNMHTSSNRASSVDNLHTSESRTMAKIIDIARAQNVAISLKAFREFSFDELISIIASLDALNKIQGERVQFMKDFLPTLSEEKAIAAFRGSDIQLQPVELFFRKLSSVPRAASKIAIIQTMANFNQQCQEVLDRFNLLFNVCNQVMNSEKLQLVLEAILTIGNIMNQGTHTGAAIGFKFESLLKLTDTKSVDGSMTILDYIVMTFIDKRQRVVLDLVSDFPDCHVASRVAITDVVNDFASLGKSIKECRTEMMKMKNESIVVGTEKGLVTNSIENQSPIENVDPRKALLASIMSRNKSKTSSDEQNQTSTVSDSPNSVPTSSSCFNKDSVIADEKSQGLLKLEEFVRSSSEQMETVEKRRNQTIQACKDLALYCGESGGERAATTILTILSEFISNLQASIVKYDQRKDAEAKKREVAPKLKESVQDGPKIKKNLNRKDVLSPRQALLKDIVTMGQKKSPKSECNQQTNIRRSVNKKMTSSEENNASTKINKTNARQELLRSIVDRAVVKKGIRREP